MLENESAPPLRQRIARPALALGSGVLVALSMPPWGFWPLAIIGVVLFEVALGSRPSTWERVRLGLLFGAGWMYLGMGWMVQLTLPGYLVAAAVFSLFHAGAALIAPIGVWRVIGRPLAHTLVEALRFSFPFGGIPLATMGMSQVGGPLVDVVRVGGVILLTWVVFQLGFALAGPAPRVPGFARRFRPHAQGEPHGAIGLLAVVVIVLLGLIAPQGSDTGEQLEVAAVQGGGEQGTSALEVPSSLVTERHLDATRSIPDDADLDLVLWPENTIDVSVFDGSDIHLAIAAEAARLDATFAVGVTEDPRVNSQIVIAPDGEIIDQYVKVRRVPFGEYVPLRGILEALGAPVEQIGHEANAGTGPAYVDLPDGTRLGVVISWEVFFAGRAREGIEAGGEAILNPTNGASYTGTIVQTQQVASSRTARDRERTLGRPGRTHRVHRDRRRRRDRAAAHRSQRAAAYSTRRSTCATVSPGTRTSATDRSSSHCWRCSRCRCGSADGRSRQPDHRQSPHCQGAHGLCQRQRPR